MPIPLIRLVRPGVALLRVATATYDVKILHSEIEDSIYARGEVPIYCSWHQRWFAGITLMPRRHPIAIMVSQSRDGELIARLIAALGWHVVRGSSTRGGTKALRQLLDCLRRGIAVGHIVDGPQGPFGEVKPGLLSLAQISGMPIVPMIIAPERKWVFSSWDRFMVPKPFSRVLVRFDREIYIPRRLEKDETDALRNRIEQRLYSLYNETDGLWISRSAVSAMPPGLKN
jgi:lysophospholipid acyltransferase (LPLAT)-like uncharacterized protein